MAIIWQAFPVLVCLPQESFLSSLTVPIDLLSGGLPVSDNPKDPAAHFQELCLRVFGSQILILLWSWQIFYKITKYTDVALILHHKILKHLAVAEPQSD
jgi:hypothetical protein